MPDLTPLILSIKLATVTTVVLLLIGTPFAWWLSNTKTRFKSVIEAVVAMPIVLPPTVMGFYLMVLLGPKGAVGAWWIQLTGDSLTFTFSGLVIASIVYSFPFVIQPLQIAFEGVYKGLLETAATLGASPLDAFFTVAVPIAKRGFLTATVMGFAHTLGEFGVVLMVGGNIPGETRVIAIDIYDHVEMLNYNEANTLSAILLMFSFVAMLTLFFVNRKRHGNG